MSLSLLEIRSFHSSGMGESPKLKLNLAVWDLVISDAAISLCCDKTQWKAPNSAMTQVGGIVMSCSDSFVITTGTLFVTPAGSVIEQLLTQRPPGKEDWLGCSIMAHCSAEEW